jgi:hypothetical protein
MPQTITVEEVERFRASDLRAAILVRHRQVVRAAFIVTATDRCAVYTVAGQRVDVRQVPGGYTATHACLRCQQDRPCFRALAAVDAEGTERFIATCAGRYAEGKRAMIR